MKEVCGFGDVDEVVDYLGQLLLLLLPYGGITVELEGREYLVHLAYVWIC